LASAPERFTGEAINGGCCGLTRRGVEEVHTHRSPKSI
jgi:hypothetical protein